MDDEEIANFIDSLVEDFSLEELHDTERIVAQYQVLTVLTATQIQALLFGAIQVALLRRNTTPHWKSELLQRTIRH